jgi:hypothetical protein
MPFATLPDSSRLWLLALESAPGPAAQAQLEHGLTEIVAQWRHKGQAYQGACALLSGQIIAVAEPNLATNPSGCAIDGMLRKIDRLASQLALDLVDPAESVLVRQDGALRPIPKTALGGCLEEGTLTAATPVVDLGLYSLADLRAGRLEAPLASTWIARKYAVTTAG